MQLIVKNYEYSNKALNVVSGLKVLEIDNLSTSQEQCCTAIISLYLVLNFTHALLRYK